jgi:hypothetical protein
MVKRTASTKATRHPRQCFAELLSRDPELSALRADYARKPTTERRAAAEWVYDESISNSLFGAALARLQGQQLSAPGWPPGFAALPGQARSIALRLQPANRSVGWPWSPPAVSPAFREGVNVLFTGTEEIEKVHAHVFAGLADAQ